MSGSIKPPPVDQGETVARYVYQKSDFSTENNCVKPKVFMPELWEGKLETSVSRSDLMSDERLWFLADTVRDPKKAIALGKVKVIDVEAKSHKLTVKDAPDFSRNYSEHAVIIDWPEDKSRQKALSLELCQSTILVKRS